MVNNTIRTSGNPFLNAAKELATKRPATAGPARSVGKARLNVIPDESSLLAMIDRALQALSQGKFWDRGSIVNLLV